MLVVPEVELTFIVAYLLIVSLFRYTNEVYKILH